MLEQRTVAEPTSASPPTWMILLAFVAAALFLVVKGVTNASVFAFGVGSAWLLLRDSSGAVGSEEDRGRRFLDVLCLLAPLFTLLFAHVGQQVIHLPAYDGPSRLLLMVPFYLYLLRVDCSRIIFAFALGCATSVLLVTMSLVFFKDTYWGYRAATYFVDPITLPAYTVISFSIFLFVNPLVSLGKLNHCIKLSLLILVLFILIESASRTAWIALTGVLIIWLTVQFWGRSHLILAGITVILFFCVGFYFSSDLVRLRIDDVINVMSYFLYGRVTEFTSEIHASAVGHRIVGFMVDCYVIKENIWFGISDRDLVSYEELVSNVPLLNEEIYEIRKLAGSHSEFLAQLAEKGVFLGGASIGAIFLYPIGLVLRRGIRGLDIYRGPELAFGLIVPCIFCGLTIQILNLKMTISFFGLALAIALAAMNRK